MIGTNLSHFHIVEKIGEGGMGVVYRAEDERLRRPVALKVLPPELVSNEERRLRFLREARAAAAVSHPNIAAVYDIGEAEGVVFIAMELVEGKTLRELMGGRPLPVKDALRIGTEMAEGLAHAHQAHVIHRDLKPDNVIVRLDQHVKILDFGLAKLLEEHAAASTEEQSKLETISGEVTRAGRVLGTPAYMSPEQARGRPLDARSDIFAFGSTLYEVVTGRPPFRGKTPADILSAILRDEPVAPSQLNSEVPLSLGEIIAKCLEKDAGDRYQDARDLVVDLRRARRVTEPGVPVARTPSAPVAVAPSSGWTRMVRSAALRTSLVTGLVVLLIAAGAATWWWARTPGRFHSGDKVLVADFENATGQREFDTAVRDAFEHMLTESRFLRVIVGEDLGELLVAHTGGAVSRIDADLVNELCGKGDCAGYLGGRIEKEGSGYRLRVGLYKVGKKVPAISLSAFAPGEQEILLSTHNLVMDLRRALGEAPASISEARPPTTRSLSAFQALAKGGSGTASLSSIRRALEIDPNFVDAYSSMASLYSNRGDVKEARKAAEQAYRLSSSFPEQVRFWTENDYLDSLYDFDTETERLLGYQERYPSSASAANNLAWLYLFVYEDPVKAERASEDAYRLEPIDVNLWFISTSLRWQGRTGDIEKLADDFRSRGGSEGLVGAVLAWVQAMRLDLKKLQETVDQSPRGGAVRTWVEDTRGFALLAAGRLKEGERAVSADLQAYGSPDNLRMFTSAHEDYLRQAWLQLRRSGTASPFPQGWVEVVRGNFIFLPSFAAMSVEARASEPLARLIQEHEQSERSSKSRFVREELQFARGCLALTRGEAGRARQLLEPLAQNSILVRRHRVLARSYEALGMWREAAAEYEESLKNPFHKWAPGDIPALHVLNQFRLAQIYDRLGNAGRARQWYERFLTDWKDADPDIPELTEARQRLAALNAASAGPR